MLHPFITWNETIQGIHHHSCVLVATHMFGQSQSIEPPPEIPDMKERNALITTTIHVFMRCNNRLS